jgi:hypothetical protein
LGILWSYDEKKHPNWLEPCIHACRRQGFIWWDVDWRIDFAQFTFPVKGYIWNTVEGKATHGTLINTGSETICQPEKEKAREICENLKALRVNLNENSPLLEYLRDERETLTVIKLTNLGKLSVPLTLESFKLWNERPVSKPPQSYCRIRLP